MARYHYCDECGELTPDDQAYPYGRNGEVRCAKCHLEVMGSDGKTEGYIHAGAELPLEEELDRWEIAGLRFLLWRMARTPIGGAQDGAETPAPATILLGS